ncbi:hypothetical protein AADZ90_012910 [Aestuariibius sp. 2305UL40-4]|uniref:hypothetical protein n=1 Tax=Aestuariibius violaceus TaxID=3234132 RepID=UPI00345EF833
MLRSALYAIPSALALIAVPKGALAFNFGFVRAPDYMDPYFAILLVFMTPFFLALLIAKPRDVPFNRLYANVHRLGIAGKVYYYTFYASFIVLMLMLFAGMGLQRMAEAGV